MIHCEQKMKDSSNTYLLIRDDRLWETWGNHLHQKKKVQVVLEIFVKLCKYLPILSIMYLLLF